MATFAGQIPSLVFVFGAVAKYLLTGTLNAIEPSDRVPCH